MPQAVPFIASAVKTYVVWAAKHAVLASIIKTVLINVALGALQKSLAGTPRRGTVDNIPINVTLRGTTEFRRFVYGTRRLSGVMGDYGAASSGGSTNDRLAYIVLLAGHQCSAIRDVWIDNVRIAEADIAADGLVTAGQYAGVIRIIKHLGTSGQAADPQVLSRFPDYDSTYRLSGITYLLVSCSKDDTKFTAGSPQNISALVDGALLYDMRLDSTNGGSGSHRKDNPSTWAFSRNPALALRNFLTCGPTVNDVTSPLNMYGFGVSDAGINDTFFAACANICDEVLTSTEATPDGDDIRYQCDGEFSSDQTYRTVINDICESMAGTATDVHGKWRAYAGAYDSPVHTITQNQLYGGLRVQDTDSHKDRYNAVCAIFIDSAQQYVEQPTIYRTDSAYEALDGGERIAIDIALKAVTNKWQAQRLAEIRLRKSRMQRRPVLTGALDMLRCALHEAVALSHERWGWSSRVVRVTDRQFEFDQDAGRVTLTCQRDDSAVYNDLLTADYETGTSDTDTFQEQGPSAPTNFAVTDHFGSAYFTWEKQHSANETIEIWKHSAATPFSAATKIYEGTGNAALIPKATLDAEYYWIRARRGNQYSGTDPASSGLAVANLPVIGGWTPHTVVSAGGVLTILPNGRVTKVGGTNAWNANIYSLEGYVDGCEVTFVPGQTGKPFIIGLGTYQATDNLFEFGWFCTALGAGNDLYIIEGGATIGPYGTYDATTRLQIRYDGSTVRYYKDGVLILSRTAQSITAYLNGAFYGIGASATIVTFHSQTPVLELDKKLVPDPEFSLASDDRFWTLLGDAAIDLTGGEVGGCLIFSGSASDVAVSKRYPDNVILPGKNLAFVTRFRRHGAITPHSGSNVEIDISLLLYNTAGDPFTGLSATIGVQNIVLHDGGGDNYTNDEWTTEAVTVALDNVVSGVTYKYFQVQIASGNMDAGEGHVDSFAVFETV